MPPLLTDRRTSPLIADLKIEVLQTTTDLLSILLVDDNRAIGISPDDLRGVGAEPESTVIIKLLDRPDQPHNSIAKQVIKRVVRIDEFLHDRENQSQVGLHDPITMPLSQRNQLFDEINSNAGRTFHAQQTAVYRSLMHQKVHAFEQQLFLFLLQQRSLAQAAQMDRQVDTALSQCCNAQLAASWCKSEFLGKDFPTRPLLGELRVADEPKLPAKPPLGERPQFSRIGTCWHKKRLDVRVGLSQFPGIDPGSDTRRNSTRGESSVLSALDVPGGSFSGLRRHRTVVSLVG